MGFGLFIEPLSERREALPTKASEEVWNPLRVLRKIGDQATKGAR
jgi:hypothetical protein